jgi:hypothetical protein
MYWFYVREYWFGMAIAAGIGVGVAGEGIRGDRAQSPAIAQL